MNTDNKTNVAYPWPDRPKFSVEWKGDAATVPSIFPRAWDLAVAVSRRRKGWSIVFNPYDLVIGRAVKIDFLGSNGSKMGSCDVSDREGWGRNNKHYKVESPLASELNNYTAAIRTSHHKIAVAKICKFVKQFNMQERINRASIERLDVYSFNKLSDFDRSFRQSLEKHLASLTLKQRLQMLGQIPSPPPAEVLEVLQSKASDYEAWSSMLTAAKSFATVVIEEDTYYVCTHKEVPKTLPDAKEFSPLTESELPAWVKYGLGMLKLQKSPSAYVLDVGNKWRSQNGDTFYTIANMDQEL